MSGKVTTPKASKKLASIMRAVILGCRKQQNEVLCERFIDAFIKNDGISD